MKQITTAMLFASLLFSPAWAEESAEIDPSKYDREVLEQMVRGMHERVKQLEAEVERLQDVIREGGHRRSSYVPKPIKPVADNSTSTKSYPFSVRQQWSKQLDAEIAKAKGGVKASEDIVKKHGQYHGGFDYEARADKYRQQIRELESQRNTYVPPIEQEQGSAGTIGSVSVKAVDTAGAVVRDSKGREWVLSVEGLEAGQRHDFKERAFIYRRDVRHEGKTLPLIEPL